MTETNDDRPKDKTCSAWAYSVTEIRSMQWADALGCEEANAFATAVARGKVQSLIIPEGNSSARYVSAKEFAQWLALQNLSPSILTQSWLTARQVIWPLQAPKEAEVVPEEGWLLDSPFGYQATSLGVQVVRLEELIYFVKKEWNRPTKAALYEVLGALIQDSGELGDKWLHVLDGVNGYAQALLNKGKPYPNIIGIETIPGIMDYTGGHPATAEDILRAVGEHWIENGLPVDNAVTFARRLAIPISAAHDAFGWGRIANEAATPLHTAANTSEQTTISAPAAIEPAPIEQPTVPKTIDELATLHGKTATKDWRWEPYRYLLLEHKERTSESLAAMAKRFKDQNGKAGAMKGETIRKQIEKARSDREKESQQRATG